VGHVGNDCLTEPELFGERPNNTSRSKVVLQSPEEATSHNRHFVLKSDTKLTPDFVCDLGT
jgi:hypothetical protein